MNTTKNPLPFLQSHGIQAQKILHSFSILHNGWETDNEGWIVELPPKTKAAYTTNHGKPQLLQPQEIAEKLKETQESADALSKALDLLS